MERWRWLPPVLEGDRIMVNAANAELELWLDGKSILRSRVVVGRSSTRTPILRAEGVGITFNPPWTVPRSIAAKEILPKLKRNPSWLADHDMFLLDGPAGDPHGLRVDWRAIRAGTFPYQIRQNPGPRNPLGQIKLELPNRFDVYLHDTSNHSDFKKPKRQLSHGCVRVEQILPLATQVLGADSTATQKIAEATGRHDTSYLALPKKIPIYLLYWTAVPHDGTVEFLDDTYGRDQRLIAAMHTTSVRLASIEAPCTRG
jgi:murein L,D-transpeptidase YcbB/YkuD